LDGATVDVALTGDAVAGTDYTTSLVGGQLSFAAGETMASFTVTPIDDALVEGDESVIATISSPSDGGTIATASATATIEDNERITNITAHGNGGSSTPVVSADGSTIVFRSSASNLIP